MRSAGVDALEDDDEEVRRQALWALSRVMREPGADLDLGDLARRLRRALIGEDGS